jgi:hypothetical protein
LFLGRFLGRFFGWFLGRVAGARAPRNGEARRRRTGFVGEMETDWRLDHDDFGLNQSKIMNVIDSIV